MLTDWLNEEHLEYTPKLLKTTLACPHFLLVHACLCMHARACMLVCACLCLHACACMLVPACLCVHACACMLVPACLCMHACACMLARACNSLSLFLPLSSGNTKAQMSNECSLTKVFSIPCSISISLWPVRERGRERCRIWLLYFYF